MFLRYDFSMWLRPRPSPTGSLEEPAQRVRRIEAMTRKQLARRLHDGPTQTVSAMAMRADIARRQMDLDPAAATEELAKLEELARATASDLRHVQFTLMPQSLHVAGLETAWEDLVEQLKSHFQQEIELSVDRKAVRALSEDQQELLFFIGSEALDNACKHAEATAIKLSLSRPETEVVLLEVVDNGKAFDFVMSQQTAEEEGKFGLAIMYQRVKLLPGELSVHSEPGQGTQLRVALIAARGRMNED